MAVKVCQQKTKRINPLSQLCFIDEELFTPNIIILFDLIHYPYLFILYWLTDLTYPEI